MNPYTNDVSDGAHWRRTGWANANRDWIAHTTSLAIGRSPYSKGAARLAAALEKPVSRTKAEQLRYNLGKEFACETYLHGAPIARGDSHFDAGAADQYARLTQTTTLLAAMEAIVERAEYVSQHIDPRKRNKGVSQVSHVVHMAGHLEQHAKIARAALTLATGGAK